MLIEKSIIRLYKTVQTPPFAVCKIGVPLSAPKRSPARGAILANLPSKVAI